MMAASTTTKYGFRIRTRDGMVVENLMIHGRDEADAERKLRQMYLHCEVLECSAMQPAMMQPTKRYSSVSFEDVISLISK
jgi:hypothetical protein